MVGYPPPLLPDARRGSQGYAGLETRSSTMALAKLNEDIQSIVTKAGESVVEVRARRRTPSSGVAWPGDGLVVTALRNSRMGRRREARSGRGPRSSGLLELRPQGLADDGERRLWRMDDGPGGTHRSLPGDRRSSLPRLLRKPAPRGRRARGRSRDRRASAPNAARDSRRDSSARGR